MSSPGADRASSDGDGAEAAPSDGVPARSRKRLVAAGLATVLAFLLVLFAVLSPDNSRGPTPGAFVRLPLEGLVIVALAVLLPARPRKIVATGIGIALGLLTIVKLIDLGSFAILSRPYNLVLDWAFLPDGLEFLGTSLGRVGQIGVVVVIVLLVLAVPTLMSLSVLRLTRIAARHRTGGIRVVAALTVVWIASAVLGVHVVPGQRFAAKSAVDLTLDRFGRIQDGIHDHTVFAKEAKIDAFANTPPDQLLTGLRGKDVILAFVESYGRSALQDPRYSPGVDAVLDAGTKQLKADGFAARSGFLTSPTAGGGSVLAHATLTSALWINNRQRYRNLTTSNRLNLDTAFKKASWQTVGVMPGVTEAWPEGAFYQFDKLYAEKDLGYKGPSFGWATMPDQYTLAQWQKLKNSGPNHTPTMMEIPLLSSHIPWAPLPTMIPWDQIGDGSVFTAIHAAGKKSSSVWRHNDDVRAEYGKSIQYSLSALISYMDKYADKNTVLVFLGDHQPVQMVVGKGAGRDVPITIVAKDPAVLDRVSSWNWQDGLRPGPDAPVWKMSDFRDKFLTAFGPQGATTPAAASAVTASPTATAP